MKLPLIGQSDDPAPDDLIQVYLRRHIAGAGAGAALFRRVATAISPDFREEIRAIAREVEEERAWLLKLAVRFRATRPRLQESIGAVAQELGRLNPTGTVVQRSPLADVIELEALAIAVHGKLLGFRTWQELAATEPRLDADECARMCAQAEDQRDRLEVMRLEAVRRAMSPTQQP